MRTLFFNVSVVYFCLLPSSFSIYNVFEVFSFNFLNKNWYVTMSFLSVNSHRSVFLAYSLSFLLKLKVEKYSVINSTLWSRVFSIRYSYFNMFKLHQFRTRRFGGWSKLFVKGLNKYFKRRWVLKRVYKKLASYFLSNSHISQYNKFRYIYYKLLGKKRKKNKFFFWKWLKICLQGKPILASSVSFRSAYKQFN